MTSVLWRADAYPRSREILRFAIVGGGSALLYIALTIGLARATDALAASSVVAYVISGAFSFVGHRSFTFVSRGPLIPEAARFALLNVAGLGAALAAPLIVTDWLGFPATYATALACLIVPPLNFLAMRGWVFYQSRLRSYAA